MAFLVSNSSINELSACSTRQQSAYYWKSSQLSRANKVTDLLHRMESSPGRLVGLILIIERRLSLWLGEGMDRKHPLTASGLVDQPFWK